MDATPSLLAWSTNPVPWLGGVLGVVAYLGAVRRVRRAHPRTPFPRSRTVAWVAGVTVATLALVSPIDAYAEDLLTVHMVQHLLLAMVAPPLLALGAPVTLALRAAGPRLRGGVLLPILHSRAVRVLASPLLAWTALAVVMAGAHFTPLYEAALESEPVHMAEHLLFLAVGSLFWWPVVGADPNPGRLGFGARLAYLGAQMPVHAAVGLAIYLSPTVLYPAYAAGGGRWGLDPLTDQQVGGILMWAAGDLVLLVALAAVVAAWIRADSRRARRADARYST